VVWDELFYKVGWSELSAAQAVELREGLGVVVVFCVVGYDL
jgi:hypothetical protein